MPAMSALTTFTDGSIIHQADLNNLSTNVDTLTQQVTGKPASAGASSKPLCKLLLAGPQGVITNGPTQQVFWDTKAADTDNMWSVSAPDHMVIQTPGWYRIRAQAYYAAASSGPASSERVVQILINGLLDPLNVTATSTINMSGSVGSTCLHQVATTERLAAGAGVYVGVFQNSGATLNLLTNGSWGTWFTAAWAAPY